jgi:hypothetical protein
MLAFAIISSASGVVVGCLMMAKKDKRGADHNEFGKTPPWFFFCDVLRGDCSFGPSHLLWDRRIGQGDCGKAGGALGMVGVVIG